MFRSVLAPRNTYIPGSQAEVVHCEDILGCSYYGLL